MSGGLLHANASARSLGFARVWVFGMCLGDVVREPVLDLADLPFEYLSAVGPLALLPESWRRLAYTAPALAGLKAVLVALLATCVLGVRPFRPIAVTTCTLLTVLHALLRSVGHVNHGELPMLYAAYVLAVFPSTDERAVGGASRPAAPYAAAMVLMSLVYCLTYAFTAGYRMAASAPDIFVDGSVMRLVVEPVLKPGVFATSHGAELLTSPLAPAVLASGFAVVTLLEFLSPVALFVRWFRWLWIAGIVLFHLFAWFVMQIPFVHNLILMPLLMLDLEGWIRPRAAPGYVDWEREWHAAWKPHRANAWFRHQADVLGTVVGRAGTGGRVLKTDGFEEACGLPSLGGSGAIVMDISPRIVARAARTRDGAGAACATDVRRLAFRRGAFAAVVSHSTLDHFAAEDDIRRALREIHRVLEAGGRLVLTLDNPENPVLAARRAIHDVVGRVGGLIPFAMGRTLSRAAMVGALESEGFTVVESAYVLHAPRLVALWAAEWAARGRMEQVGHALGVVFRWLERVLGSLPTRRWTAHFVVADCRATYRADT